MTIDLASVTDILARRLPLYRRRKPVYQTVMLQSLRRLWRPEDRRVLDIGGGTGVIAEAMSRLLPVDHVTSIDVEERFLTGLQIETAAYDGRSLPFRDQDFDCVVFNNVIHHIELEDRPVLLAECRRVLGSGSILIKDHLARGPLDHLRLALLDLLGNVPFHGMVRARYLTSTDWEDLARTCGYEIREQISGPYRSPLLAAFFPNRLEITMLWRPVDA